MSAQPLPSTEAPRKSTGRAPARSASASVRQFGRGRLAIVPAPARARRAPFVVLLLVLLASGLIGLLLLNTASAQDSFHLQALQDEDAALQQQQQALTGMADGLDDPATLAKRAEELGLVPGGAPLFLPRGQPIPKGAIRVGNLIYAANAVPVPTPPPVVPTPAAKPSAQAAVKTPAVKKPATKVPAVRHTVTPVKPTTKALTTTRRPTTTTSRTATTGTRVTATTAPAAGAH